MRHLLSLLLILLLLSSCINKNLANYNTNKIERFITNNIKYPEDAVSQNLSWLVLAKIVFKKEGDIDSIFSLNSPESEFTNALISVLKKSNKSLYEGVNKIPLLFAAYFLHGDANDTIQNKLSQRLSAWKYERISF